MLLYVCFLVLEEFKSQSPPGWSVQLYQNEGGRKDGLKEGVKERMIYVWVRKEGEMRVM